jgi:hypothetical protein
LYWEFHEGGFSQGVIMDERLEGDPAEARRCTGSSVRPARRHGETTDLAPEHPELVNRAKELFKSERTESADWPIKDPPAKDAKEDAEEK